MVVSHHKDDLLRCVLVLVIILSEIMKDALKLQTFQRLGEEGLTEKEVERVREALMDLDASLDRIRGDRRLAPAVQQIGGDLNELVAGILNRVLSPKA